MEFWSDLLKHLNKSKELTATDHMPLYNNDDEADYEDDSRPYNPVEAKATHDLCAIYGVMNKVIYKLLADIKAEGKVIGEITEIDQGVNIEIENDEYSYVIRAYKD